MATGAPQREYLVFTSAGVNSRIHCWIKDSTRCFDLCIVNYSDRVGLHRESADIYFECQGGKFSNLHRVNSLCPDLLARYKAIWVADDDIIISTSAINQLFSIFSRKQLTLLQPAFCIRSKISHPITKRKLFTGIRYTNFVEMTCPVIERDFLLRFLAVYDPALVGFGIDWWMLNLREEHELVAISDEICCVNPHDRFKENAMREITRLQSNAERIGTWQMIKTKYGLRQFDHQVARREYRNISAVLSVLPSYLYDCFVGYTIRLLQKNQLIKGL